MLVTRCPMCDLDLSHKIIKEDDDTLYVACHLCKFDYYILKDKEKDLEH